MSFRDDPGQWQRYVRSIAVRYVRDRSVLDDAVAEGILGIIEHLGSVREEATEDQQRRYLGWHAQARIQRFAVWVSTPVSGADRVRGNSSPRRTACLRDAFRVVRPSDDDAGEWIYADRRTMQLPRHDERIDAMLDAMDRLPEVQRYVLHRTCGEGATCRQVGQEIGRSKSRATQLRDAAIKAVSMEIAT